MCGKQQRQLVGPLWILVTVNSVREAVASTLLLYADDSYILHQLKDVVKIKKRPNEDFENPCGWFLDNKLNIHFREDETKSNLFARKRKAKNIHIYYLHNRM